MSVRLRDLIRSVRACKTAAEERATIAKELAAVRTSFKEEEAEYRHRNVAKLMFIHMLGYNTAFGQMECLKLIAAPTFPEKRLGYLALNLLLDERQEVLMLVTNSLKNDLNHPNQYIAGLALTALGNISSQEMARDLAPEVEKLLGSSNPYLRKKAALCAIRVFRKVPELIDNFLERLPSLLNDRNHAVLGTGVSMVLEVCQANPGAIAPLRKLVPNLVRILKNLVLSGYEPEHDVAGICDPFLQVKLLLLLQTLGKGDAEASDQMSDILAQVATNTETSKNAGNAILYQCVQTIMGIESESGLRVLAINILGRFLLNRDNNIRYVALQTLSKVVNIDTQAVQRHRQTIVDCLKDPDISIRRRALELVYALVNESNIRALVKEMLSYLVVADVEFKPDLVAKICTVVEKYAPNKRWHLDTIFRVMSLAGTFVRDEVASSIVLLISQSSELHQYASRKSFSLLVGECNQQVLIQVGSWCIGEYGDQLIQQAPIGDDDLSIGTPSEEDVVTCLERLIRDPLATLHTRQYVLTALIKLSTRLASPRANEQVQRIIHSYKDSIVLELQQRACEYSTLFQWDTLRPAILERMPPIEEEQLKRRSMREQPADDGGKQSPPPQSAWSNEKEVASSSLLDLDLGVPLGPGPVQPGGASPSPVVAPAGPVAASTLSNADVLLTLLGPGPSAVPMSSMPSNAGLVPATNPLEALMGMQPISQAPLSPALAVSSALPASMLPSASNTSIPSLKAYERHGLVITFDFSKQEGDPQTTMVGVLFSNNNATPVNNVVLQAAVPKYIKLQMLPASGTSLPPNAVGAITQQIRITNTLFGQKPVVMKLKLDFELNGVPVSDMADLPSFPAGL